MSGPKVVRIVTREERIALCEAQARLVEHGFSRFEAERRRLGVFSESDLSTVTARREYFRELLRKEALAELQQQVPLEIEYLARDLAQCQQQIVLKATQRRQRKRQLRENASTLIAALKRSSVEVPTIQLAEIEEIAAGSSEDEAEDALARGYALLSKAPTVDTLTESQRNLAKSLKNAEEPLPDGLAEKRLPDSPREIRINRIDRHICELQALCNQETVEPFIERLALASNEVIESLKNVLLDSLVLDLSEAIRHRLQVQQVSIELERFVTELHLLDSHAGDEILRRLANCDRQDLPSLIALKDECSRTIASVVERKAAKARREAVLNGLSSLGYEVREGMKTSLEENGKLVLRRASTPGYGVEIGGDATNGRLQLRPVALSETHDKSRDRDIETIWCGEFQKLRTHLAEHGGSLEIERAFAVGQVPLKIVTDLDSVQDVSTDSKPAVKHI